MTSVKTTFPFPEVYEGGSGDPLILIHGFTETWRVWLPILKLLEPHYRVIAPTLPGHIGGQVLNERATPLAIANAMAQQLRDRGITKAHIVGQSLGGWVTYEMVRHGLARSAQGLSPGGAFRDRQVVVDFIGKSRGMLKMLRFLVPVILFLSRFAWLRKRLFAAEMEHADRMPHEVVVDRFDRVMQMTIFEEFLDPDLRPIEPLPADHGVPVQVAWCEKDTTLPFEKFGQPMLDTLGLESAVVLKGCGHNPMYDDPEGVAKVILDFTRAVERDERK